MYYVYILRCGDDSLYTGITTDLSRRLQAHQAGKGAKYTRSHLPVTLVYWETQPGKSAALRRELQLKALTRAEKLRLIAENPSGEIPDASESPNNP
ncbi:MAG: GIY-YIG nuclease family protein [Oscillospiraceae bacterium]|nr:GIY-YIG nuclease family protein [Oscillospiraceae bacterium]